MAARKRKSTITPEIREEWLRRYEEGESPPKIAGHDYDVRTVRKHIERAMQEKEVTEARATVLRNALERHYNDLCSYAERLGGHKTGRASGTIYDKQLASALRQHIPKSPVWRYLDQKNKLDAEIAQLKKELERKIEDGVKSDSRLPTGEAGVAEGLIAVLKFKIEHGFDGINVEENLVTKPLEDGYVELCYGAFSMGKVRKDNVDKIRDFILEWEERVKGWEEFERLRKSHSELGRVEKNLREETAVIALRRVVPGRCRYCPLQEYRRR